MKFGIQNAGLCLHCRSTNGLQVTKDNIDQIMQTFFINGTITPLYQHTVFRITESDFIEPNWDYPLTGDVIEDLKLINDIFHLSVFTPLVNQRYAWGGTEERYLMEDEMNNNKKSRNKKSFKYIDSFLEQFPTYEIPRGTTLYRIRKNPQNPHAHSEYDTPPYCIKNPSIGRLNEIGSPIFYCSEDPDNCIFECKFEPTDKILMAVLKTTKQLKLLNLTNQEFKNDTNNDTTLFMDAIFRSNCDYTISQAIANRAKVQNHRGICYPGFFNRYQKQFKRNIALFGFPIHDQIVEVQSVNRIQINEIQYNWEYGPA